MKTWQCLIVDDEPIAREIIQNYCAHLPALGIVAACGNALEAKTILEKNAVDILFLDINMPVLDGIAFVNTLKNIPQLIFTTAYREHAATAFDLSACDYLVKPFSLERFIVAVDKAIENLVAKSKPESNKEDSSDHLFLKVDGKIFQLRYHDVLFAEAKGNYTQVVTSTKTYLTPMSFSSVEAMLPGKDFVRVHRSFIISQHAFSHIEGNTVYMGNTAIPIGSHYKDGLMKRLGLR